MDIQYLLFLQNLREATGGVFAAISLFRRSKIKQNSATPFWCCGELVCGCYAVLRFIDLYHFYALYTLTIFTLNKVELLSPTA